MAGVVVRPRTRRTLLFAAGVLVFGMVGCLAIAGWLERRKHARSGVPAGHFALAEGDRRFYVPRGGPPIEQRPQVGLTAEQHRIWEEYDQSSRRWGSAGVLCFCAAAGDRRVDSIGRAGASGRGTARIFRPRRRDVNE